MENDYNELDRLFKQAFSRIEIDRPDENIGWAKMQKKLCKKKIHSLLFVSVAASFIGVLMFFISFKESMNLPYSDLKKTQQSIPPWSFENSETSSAISPSSKDKTKPKNMYGSESIDVYTPLHKTEDISNTFESDFTHIHDYLAEIPPRPLNTVKPAFDKNLAFINIDENIPIRGKKLNLNWAISIGFMVHNHWVEDGKLMGNNLPSVGVLISKNIQPNINLIGGFRYMQRNNMAYRTFSKIREVYNQEEFNLYTLYVNGAHWIEIPMGIQYFLPEKRIYFGALLTTDVLLYQSAKLGIKTQIPALGFESEERLKRAWNYDSGIPRINMGLRTELGIYLNHKNSINLFSKVSPYSGESNAKTNKNIGLDLGIEWRYFF